MTGEFEFPPAPEIGGDSYEVAEWLEKVANHYGQVMNDGDPSDAAREILQAFWEANPETTPTRVLEARQKRIQSAHERKIERQVEIQAMKDPAWIFKDNEPR